MKSEGTALITGGGRGIGAATDDTLTMAPPAPPRAVDMRRTASRAHPKLPITLMENMRCSRAALISSTRCVTSTTPALLTSARSGGSSASMRAYIASTCASSATSAWMASACPPFARMRTATSSADAASRA